MLRGHKTAFSLIAVSLLLFHLLFPVYSGNLGPETNETIFSCSGALFLECLRQDVGTSQISQEGQRQFLRHFKRSNDNMTSVGILDMRHDSMARVKTIFCQSIQIVYLMVFLTIIIYIFRSDGKKRYVNG